MNDLHVGEGRIEGIETPILFLDGDLQSTQHEAHA